MWICYINESLLYLLKLTLRPHTERHYFTWCSLLVDSLLTDDWLMSARIQNLRVCQNCWSNDICRRYVNLLLCKYIWAHKHVGCVKHHIDKEYKLWQLYKCCLSYVNINRDVYNYFTYLFTIIWILSLWHCSATYSYTSMCSCGEDLTDHVPYILYYL